MRHCAVDLSQTAITRANATREPSPPLITTIMYYTAPQRSERARLFAHLTRDELSLVENIILAGFGRLVGNKLRLALSRLAFHLGALGFRSSAVDLELELKIVCFIRFYVCSSL